MRATVIGSATSVCMLVARTASPVPRAGMGRRRQGHRRSVSAPISNGSSTAPNQARAAARLRSARSAAATIAEASSRMASAAPCHRHGRGRATAGSLAWPESNPRRSLPRRSQRTGGRATRRTCAGTKISWPAPRVLSAAHFARHDPPRVQRRPPAAEKIGAETNEEALCALAEAAVFLAAAPKSNAAARAFFADRDEFRRTKPLPVPGHLRPAAKTDVRAPSGRSGAGAIADMPAQASCGRGPSLVRTKRRGREAQISGSLREHEGASPGREPAGTVGSSSAGHRRACQSGSVSLEQLRARSGVRPVSEPRRGIRPQGSPGQGHTTCTGVSRSVVVPSPS